MTDGLNERNDRARLTVTLCVMRRDFTYGDQCWQLHVKACVSEFVPPGQYSTACTYCALCFATSEGALAANDATHTSTFNQMLR